MTAPYSAQPRLLRIGAALAALLFLGTFAPPGLFSEPLLRRAAAIAFLPVPLDGDAPERDRIGPLAYVRGWHLTSDNPRFGGISAIHVEGRKVIALSDAGSLIRFDLPDSSGRSAGTIDTLPDGPGSPDIKSQRDVESLAVYRGRAWLGFERQNAVWRYRLSDWRSSAHHAPAEMRRWPNNSGAEGLARLPDGRFLIFSEGARNRDGSSQLLSFDGDPAVAGTRASRLGYRPPAGYRLTDAALLADGRLIILNRRFAFLEGVSAKLVVARIPDPGDTMLQGEEIADLRPPLNIDNMEAISVAVQGGRTFVWLASDDNFNPLQRTLLLQFELTGLERP